MTGIGKEEEKRGKGYSFPLSCILQSLFGVMKRVSAED